MRDADPCEHRSSRRGLSVRRKHAKAAADAGKINLVGDARETSAIVAEAQDIQAAAGIVEHIHQVAEALPGIRVFAGGVRNT